MLLEQLIEIIEYTDTDHFAEALNRFNENGIISGSTLPFLNVVFEKADVPLCNKLKSIGFIGQIEVTSAKTNQDKTEYAIYDSARFSSTDAQKWIIR
jgi:hypothetical protein